MVQNCDQYFDDLSHVSFLLLWMFITLLSMSARSASSHRACNMTVMPAVFEVLLSAALSQSARSIEWRWCVSNFCLFTCSPPFFS